MTRRPLTTGEIAGYCHVTHRAVLKWVDSGKLKAYRTPGKHSRVEVKDFLDFLNAYNMPIPPDLSFDTGKKRVLIVDDDKNIVQTIKRVLMTQNHYEIDVAYDGFDAGRKFFAFKPDMVILDIQMPGVDGYEVCAHIRKDPANTAVRILAISGVLDGAGEKRILKLGADEYLAKPFDNQDLKSKMEKLLNIRKTGAYSHS